METDGWQSVSIGLRPPTVSPWIFFNDEKILGIQTILIKMFLQTDLEDPRKKMMSCAIFCVKTVRNLHVSVFLASWDSLIE